MAVREAWTVTVHVCPVCGCDQTDAEWKCLRCKRETGVVATEFVSSEAYKIMVDRMVEVRLLAEKWRRSSDANERMMGADLLQVVDGL